MTKKILVLNGHPGTESLSGLFANAYVEEARAQGHDVRLTSISDISFDPDYGSGGYSDPKPLEPALQMLADDLAWSDHFVVLTPMWWGGLPAKLKGLFDRILLPGFAFSTREKTTMGLPSPMLQGRTGRVVFTSDTPRWFFRLVYQQAVAVQVRKQILHFIGIKPARITWFSGATDASEAQVSNWVETVRALGRAGA